MSIGEFSGARDLLPPELLGKLLRTSRENRERREAAAGEIAAAEAELRAAAEKARSAGAVAHLEAAGVDEKTRNAFRGTGIRRTAAVEAARAWLAGSKPFLVLSGGPGAGKSVAAAYVLLRATRTVRTLAHPLAEDRMALEELDASKALCLSASRLRYADRFADGRAVALHDRACLVPWLVVEELRQADLEGKGLDRFDEVMVERYGCQRRTVFTTNLTGPQLATLLKKKPHLGSRFAEGAEVVACGDEDLRKGAGA